MQKYGPLRTASGAILQAGLPKSQVSDGSATALLVRGIVTATYVADDPAHPYAQQGPLAVYCDVLIYTALNGGRVYPLFKALVSQDGGGIQGGQVWIPRAASQATSGGRLSPNAADFMSWDGDHVLVGFIDENRQQAVIVRSLPHPRADAGIGAGAPAGRRTRLRQVDGRTDLRRHQGVYWGADSRGNWVADAAAGNEGNLAPTGAELPGTPGRSGNVDLRVGAGSARTTTIVQQVGDSQTPVARESFSAAALALTWLTGPGGLTIAGSAGPLLALAAPGGAAGPTAGVTVGNGGTKAARASSVADALNAILTWLATHTHISGAAGSPSSPPVQAPSLPSPSSTATLGAAGLSLPG